MTAPKFQFTGPELQLFAAADWAVGQLPPAFPLSATVAVNPFLGQADEARAVTAARLSRVAGTRIFRDRDEVAAMVTDGRIGQSDLARAAAMQDLDLAQVQAGLEAPAPAPEALPTVACLVAEATGVDWPEFLADRLGAWSAVHFDKGQAFWPAPKGGYFAGWRGFASRDLTPGIAGLSGFAEAVADLPDDPGVAFAVTCERLGLSPEAARDYFHRLLMTMGGWAQYARHLSWVAERDGGRDAEALEMLYVRAIWDMLLLERFEDRVGAGWAEALAAYAAPVEPSLEDRIDAALQEAADRAGEAELRRKLAKVETPAQAADRPAIQAAFCIDVRSEVFRRALERADTGVRTLGFAGFFGLATSHRSMASDIVEARAPVLLSPGLESRADAVPAEDLAARVHARALRAWGRFKMAAVSAFAFVEAAGPLYLWKLAKDTLPHGKAHTAQPAPVAAWDLHARIAAAGQVLRAMSLTQNFARLVLIAGHGAGVTNAPHASALQCGACGGHAGDVNARLLAALLNDTEVRAGLREQGIEVPEDTAFIAGLHDTVSDRVRLYEDHPLPGHAGDLARLRSGLEAAGKLAREERAGRLPRAASGTALPKRGGDWSELRPEWGLAGCAGFVAAPRGRSAGADLGGRIFLHDYDWQADKEFATLEVILTAPVVVASWISLQYHGSAVAPEVFGAGNKLIHNVTGGIGVVEGNGGTLRPGLPMQSVHDGEALRHEPQRLSVVVEAPTQAISAILDRHAAVKALFDNGWLALMTLDGEGRFANRYEGGQWVPVTPEEAAALNAA
jgi:uncharacterized protein YbcC (UPF0753/DUF2309 family)